MHILSLGPRSRHVAFLALFAGLALPSAEAAHGLGLFPGRGVLSDETIRTIRGELLEVAAAFQDDPELALRYTRLRRRLQAIQDSVVEIREEQLSLARTWAAANAREVVEVHRTPMLAGNPVEAYREAYREAGDELLAFEYQGNDMTHRFYEARYLRRPRDSEMAEYVEAAKADGAPEFSGVLEKVTRLRADEAAYDADAQAFCAEATPRMRAYGLLREVSPSVLADYDELPVRVRPMGLYLHYFIRHLTPDHFESLIGWIPLEWRLRLLRRYARQHAGDLEDGWLTRVVRTLPAKAQTEILGLAAG